MTDLYRYVSKSARSHGLLDAATIDDIFQEVSLELHINPAIKLSTVTSRVIAAAIRQAKKFRCIEGIGSEPVEMSPIHHRSSYATIIKSAQRRLSADEYDMFYRIAIEGESFAAVGEKIGKTGDAVRLAMTRIGKKLQHGDAS